MGIWVGIMGEVEVEGSLFWVGYRVVVGGVGVCVGGVIWVFWVVGGRWSVG